MIIYILLIWKIFLSSRIYGVNFQLGGQVHGQQRRKQRQQRPGHAAAPAFLKGSPSSHLCTCSATCLIETLNGMMSCKGKIFYVYIFIYVWTACLIVYVYNEYCFLHEYFLNPCVHSALCDMLQPYMQYSELLVKSHETGKVSAHHVAEHSGQPFASSTDALIGGTTNSATWLYMIV